MKAFTSAAFKSWQPTLAAAVTCVFAFILLFPEHFRQWPMLLDIAKFAGLGGFFAFGISAKSAWLGSNLPTAQLPPALRDEESQKSVGLEPPEPNPTILQGIKHEEAAKAEQK